MDVVCECLVCRAKQTGVIPQPGSQPLQAPLGTRHREPGGERFRPLFEPLDAQQFVAEWFFDWDGFAAQWTEQKRHTVLSSGCRVRA
jgi:hypothetical protein